MFLSIFMDSSLQFPGAGTEKGPQMDLAAPLESENRTEEQEK
jgi:hypothetical protein